MIRLGKKAGTFNEAFLQKNALVHWLGHHACLEPGPIGKAMAHFPADLELEVCTDNLADTLAAAAQGATRIELCGRLDLDGLTPSPELLEAALATLHIPIHVMIRPRGGDFVYSAAEVEQMEASIALCRERGVPGVVFGALLPDGQLDLPTIRRLVACAKPLRTVIHKCIDRTPDPLAALAALQEIPGIDEVLTSGGAVTAAAGATTLRAMIAQSAGRPRILVAGKVTRDNLATLHRSIGATAYHGRLLVGPLQAS